jgi:hypothetical protein
MKVLSNSRGISHGFSVIEIVLALALLSIVVTGALSSQFMADYWDLSSQLSAEALLLQSGNESQLRSHASQDFYTVSSTPLSVVVDVGNPVLESCRAGGVCYHMQNLVTDISPCTKRVTFAVFWKAGARYGTSSVAERISLFNNGEVAKRGGDCVLDAWSDRWQTATPTKQVSTTTPPTFTTGIDVLGDRVYVVASSAPQFRIYRHTRAASTTLQFVSSSTVLGNRLNAVDVVRDTASGRRYAYVVQHTPNNQLVVLDVTNDVISVVTVRTLMGTDSSGSFPQGWRVLAYGGRLYVTTRETAGAELHIFSIENPTNPIELSVNAAAANLSRTVNDIAIVERMISGTLRRYLLLAASASLKEFTLEAVTGDIPVERVALDLPGTENALSVFSTGDMIYLGRGQSASGPELYQFSLGALLSGTTAPLAQSEVGADVTTIRVVGDWLFLGTSKTNAELQVWQAAQTYWNSVVANAARISFVSASKLAPLGFDVGDVSLYIIGQSFTQPEQLSVWSQP